MPLSATDQQYTSMEPRRTHAGAWRTELVEEIDSFLRRYEEQQRRDDSFLRRYEEQQRREQQRRDEERRDEERRDEERRDEDKRFWNEEAIPVLRARLSPAEQRVLVELLALLDR